MRVVMAAYTNVTVAGLARTIKPAGPQPRLGSIAMHLAGQGDTPTKKGITGSTSLCSASFGGGFWRPGARPTTSPRPLFSLTH